MKFPQFKFGFFIFAESTKFTDKTASHFLQEAVTSTSSEEKFAGKKSTLKFNASADSLQKGQRGFMFSYHPSGFSWLFDGESETWHELQPAT